MTPKLTHIRPVAPGQIYINTISEIKHRVIRVSFLYVRLVHTGENEKRPYAQPFYCHRDLYEKHINEGTFEYVTTKDMRPRRKRLLGIS